MTNGKNIKTMVDSALDDISVSEELKGKTMQGLLMKKRSWIKYAIIPAACACAVLIAVISTTGLPSFNTNQQSPRDMGNTRINTLASSIDTAEKPDSNDSKAEGDTFNSGVQVLESWKVDTLEDAKKYMNGTVLIPSYIPEGYSLKEIMAAGPKIGEAINVTMEYESKGRSFFISQDKAEKRLELVNSSKVDINGTQGYINSTKFEDTDNPIYSTDLKWYIDNTLYMVQGSIPEEEAIKTARSLK